MNLAVQNTQNAAQTASAVPDQFSQIINLLKQYQTGAQGTINQAQQQQIQRGVQTPQSLIGASPDQQNAVRSASMDALNPTIGGARDVIAQAKQAISDYTTAQNQQRDDARAVINEILSTTDPTSLHNLSKAELDTLEKNAGYPKGFLTEAVTYKQKQAALAAQKAGGGTPGGTPAGYVFGANPTADSWVQNINSGRAKLSDITGNPSLKNLVSQGLAASRSSSSDILNVTKSSLQELQDMVNKNTGFTSAVGFKGLSSFFGLRGSPIPGSPAADFDAKLKQVVNDIVLPNLTLLHGIGRVTDREFQALQSSITSLSTNISESQFKTELNNVITQINSKLSPQDQIQGSSLSPTSQSILDKYGIK